MKMMQNLARVALALAWVAMATITHAADLQEGKDYGRLQKPQPVESGAKIEVIEFFSFSCPHCRDMEPILAEWVKKLPPDVAFRRIPVVFSPAWAGTAKVWLTLEAMGQEALTTKAFQAIHSQNVRLDQDKTFFDWAAAQGLDRKKVEDMYNSFAVNGKLARAKTQTQNYAIQSVPNFVVDGKFTTDTGSPKQHAEMPALLEKLIAKAKTERK